MKWTHLLSIISESGLLVLVFFDDHVTTFQFNNINVVVSTAVLVKLSASLGHALWICRITAHLGGRVFLKRSSVPLRCICLPSQQCISNGMHTSSLRNQSASTIFRSVCPITVAWPIRASVSTLRPTFWHGEVPLTGEMVIICINRR